MMLILYLAKKQPYIIIIIIIISIICSQPIEVYNLTSTRYENYSCGFL